MGGKDLCLIGNDEICVVLESVHNYYVCQTYWYIYNYCENMLYSIKCTLKKLIIYAQILFSFC